MAEKKALSDVLNFRVDEAVAREIERMAKVEERSASEVARELIAYGVDVKRQIEASLLKLPYTMDVGKTAGRVVIEAAWRPYSQRELWEMEQEQRAVIDEAEEYGY